MSYRRDVGSYTVPFVIRNLKPRRWPTISMRICILCSFASCCAAIALMKIGAPREFALLMLAPVLLGLVGSFSIACFLLMNRPIDKVLLGEALETRPRQLRWAIDDIQQVQFVSSPEEDYREWDHQAHARDARIILRRIQGFRTISLLLSHADASRLREWARQHEIQVGAAETEV